MRRPMSQKPRRTPASARRRQRLRLLVDGNLVVEASIYDAFLAKLQEEGGYLVSTEEKVNAAGGDVG